MGGILKLKPVIGGVLSFLLPNLRTVRGGGGTSSALYCYEVWLKHLTMLTAGGASAIPQSVLEIGPGNSLGVGIAALLSGSTRYVAVDAVRRTEPTLNLKMLEELAALFHRRTPRPRKGWPDYDVFLDANLFPSDILTPERLSSALCPRRIDAIRAALEQRQNEYNLEIQYIAPSAKRLDVGQESIDLVLSHAVFQHVSDLENCYGDCRFWLKNGGMLSCQIDFSGKSLFRIWNGHWACGEFVWRVMKGRRTYLLNRQPLSTHLAYLEKERFALSLLLKAQNAHGIARSQLAHRWRSISDEDLMCSSAFFQASKLDIYS